MAPSEFRGIFNTSKTHHPVANDGGANFYKNLLTLPQMFLIGALGQTGLFAILPARYAFLSSFGLLLFAIISVVLQAKDPKNPHTVGLVHSRVSAQLPADSYNPNLKESSLFGSTPASRGVVVLLLGFRLSSPLGIFSKGGKEIGMQFNECSKELDARAEEFGLLGHSGWTTGETASNSTAMNIYYFRDLDGLNRFAHDKIHRQAWDWYNRIAKDLGYSHVGVFHETFYSAPGQYETIYVNMPPVLMGATNVPVTNEATGEKEWVRPLVDANTSSLRSQFGRMGHTMKEGDAMY